MAEAAGAGPTGSKMARRVGGVDEFEFKAIGENHNQGKRLGVEILVSGFVFEKEDFIKPWEGQNDNLERYAAAVGVQESDCCEHCNSRLAYFKTCDGADETRANDDCFELTLNCFGLASCITCSN